MGTEEWVEKYLVFCIWYIGKMQKITSFTKLDTWIEAHKLVLMIYEITDNFPSKENYILIPQIVRAVISITSNIAEGFSRYSKKEKQQFYFIAKGSLTETQNQLIIARDREYIKDSKFHEIANQTIIVHKLLNGLIKSALKKNV